MQFDPVWALGFMSGTSLDGVDAAFIRTNGETIDRHGDFLTESFEPSEKALLEQAIKEALNWQFEGDTPAIFEDAAEALTEAHIRTGQKLIDRFGGRTPELIGFHGQTVLHRRATPETKGATCQVGDGKALAKALGAPVISDFRSADVAAGGQGAPLAPAYHAALIEMRDRDQGRGGAKAVLNIGGVANITWRGRDGRLIAFDTGPGNGPIDSWIAAHGEGQFDEGGKIASEGQIDEKRLNEWLDHDYFDLPAPKSLDRYEFTHDLADGLNMFDGAATLTAFSALSVAEALKTLPEAPDEIIVTGGGRKNPLIMSLLSQLCGGSVEPAEAVGWRGDALEAEAFAFLAMRSFVGLPISFPLTTGVPEPMTGGVLDMV